MIMTLIACLFQGFLESYGYLRRPDFTTGQLLSEEDVTGAIKKMQAYAGLPPTGILDNETKKLMNTSRCGMADVGRADSARRKRRYNAQGTTWNKLVIFIIDFYF